MTYLYDEYDNLLLIADEKTLNNFTKLPKAQSISQVQATAIVCALKQTIPDNIKLSDLSQIQKPNWGFGENKAGFTIALPQSDEKELKQIFLENIVSVNKDFINEIRMFFQINNEEEKEDETQTLENYLRGFFSQKPVKIFPNTQGGYDIVSDTKSINTIKSLNIRELLVISPLWLNIAAVEIGRPIINQADLRSYLREKEIIPKKLEVSINENTFYIPKFYSLKIEEYFTECFNQHAKKLDLNTQLAYKNVEKEIKAYTPPDLKEQKPLYFFHKEKNENFIYTHYHDDYAKIYAPYQLCKVAFPYAYRLALEFEVEAAKDQNLVNEAKRWGLELKTAEKNTNPLVLKMNSIQLAALNQTIKAYCTISKELYDYLAKSTQIAKLAKTVPDSKTYVIKISDLKTLYTSTLPNGARSDNDPSVFLEDPYINIKTGKTFNKTEISDGLENWIPNAKVKEWISRDWLQKPVPLNSTPLTQLMLGTVLADKDIEGGSFLVKLSAVTNSKNSSLEGNPNSSLMLGST